VIVEVDGISGSGQGMSTDILEAGGLAYVRALSNAVRRRAVAEQAKDAATGQTPELVRGP